MEVSRLERGRLKDYYRHVQGVFQDPFSSCNPLFRVDRLFSMIHTEYFSRVSASEWRERIEATLDSVRLDPAQILGKYPRQLSGGRLQRLLIARELTLVRLLVADEIIMLIAFVPHLHEKWQDDGADEAWRALTANGQFDAAPSQLVEVEPGHLVARCAQVTM